MTGQDDELSIRALVETWLAATERGDAATVLSLIAEDALFLTPGQEPMTKSGFATAMAGLRAVHLQMNSQIQEIRVMGEWAYCWNKLTVTVTPRNGGTPMKRAGSALSILRKQHGAWSIVRDANMLAAVASA